MEKKKILILGAGISGLSLAYYLRKHPFFEITLLEKEGRAGGWIGQDRCEEFFFEQGPRTFRYAKAQDILAMVKELELEEEIIFSHDKSKRKYVWIEDRLRKAPIWNFSFLKGVLKEWAVPKGVHEDESIWNFACRRFNSKIAAQVFDPMTVGVYAGDVKKLSVRACFPFLKEWEDRYGSVTKGILKSKRKKKPTLFSFQQGLQSLVVKLASIIPILYGQEVQKIDFFENKAKVRTQKGEFEADFIFSALPCPVVAELIDPELRKIKMTGSTVVNLGYRKDVLGKKGFGYIVSSQENEDVLGVIFNSNIFPQHNKSETETRLTVMLKNTNMTRKEARSKALKGIKKQLGITTHPQAITVSFAKKAFPQMEVGHIQWIKQKEKELERKYPHLRLVGNYLYGVGVSDCVTRAKSVADNFLKTQESWSKSSGV